jgi:hypothetical protein
MSGASAAPRSQTDREEIGAPQMSTKVTRIVLLSALLGLAAILVLPVA